jgi:hypothetical protein
MEGDCGMGRIRVDFGEIRDAMQEQDREEFEDYLDKETGVVVVIPRDVLRAAKKKKSPDEFPEWMKSFAPDALGIVDGPEGRYTAIPSKPSYEVYNWMVDFADNVPDDHLGEKLIIALDGKGAFRRFKNVLEDYPDYREKWFQFEQERLDRDIGEWLDSLGIEYERK